MHHWKLFAGPAGPLDYFLKAIGHFLASSGFLLMGIVAFVFLQMEIASILCTGLRHSMCISEFRLSDFLCICIENHKESAHSRPRVIWSHTT